ncbi:hypothetical protein [Bradyrhizobium sp. WSM1743]|uniref:hypothetical protein n=1 Tax=Bradyrhizobium sp. WSM1743 TaxID=318996 RepID=UPI000401630A|nr:hypothetical protein [Bradyrhizobium sp. WSM1743]
MARSDYSESVVKSGHQISDRAFSDLLKADTNRTSADVHRLLGDPRVSVGVPVRDQMTTTGNLVVK